MDKDIARLIAASVVECKGSCAGNNATLPVDAIVQSFENGSTRVLCPYAGYKNSNMYCNSRRTSSSGDWKSCYYVV